MCPFSLLTRCWMIFILILMLGQYVLSQVQSKWTISCDPQSPTVYMDYTTPVTCNVSGTDQDNLYVLQVQSADSGILAVNEEISLTTEEYEEFSVAKFNITGNFLGKTKVLLKVQSESVTYYEESMDVTVIRKTRAIDTIFTISVATLVTLIYINFGCAVDWHQFKLGLKRPIGPLIGFIAQFVFMPLLSFGLGKALFPNSTDLQLGMFFSGIAPAGGASNMWALLLGANVNLSITMTTISNIAAFAMMPLWLFTLGKQIFASGDISVPYGQIMMYSVALVVPLFIGYLIQRYLKRVGKFLARILKGFSSLLLIFIIVFAIATNAYLFKLFSWQIIISGLGLPWLGYTLGWILAKICRQSSKDALTIAIEAGIQNTGIPIFLLRAVLPQPEADISTIAPVAVATMTPIPLLLLLIYIKIRERYCTKTDGQQKFIDIEESTENGKEDLQTKS